MTNGEIGLPPVRFRNQVLVKPKYLRQMIENLSDADDRKIFGIHDGVAPRSPHPLPTHAKESESLCSGGLCRDSRHRLSSGAKLCRGLAGSNRRGKLRRAAGCPCPSKGAPQSLNQLRPIHFSGCFSGRDQE